MALCGELTQGLSLDCDNLSSPGVRDKMYLANFDQKGTITVDALNPLRVEAWALAGGALLYEFEGLNNSNDGETTSVRSGFRTQFQHLVRFRAFQVDAATKKILEDLTKGKVVAVLVTNSETIEIFGWNAGLIVPDGGLVWNLKDLETGGGFTITLQSDDNTPEKSLPLSYVGSASPYDFATALSEIEAKA